MRGPPGQRAFAGARIDFITEIVAGPVYPMIEHIIGFEMALEGLEGKFKLGHDRSPETAKAF